jgi:hypothetical protein
MFPREIIPDYELPIVKLLISPAMMLMFVSYLFLWYFSFLPGYYYIHDYLYKTKLYNSKHPFIQDHYFYGHAALAVVYYVIRAKYIFIVKDKYRYFIYSLGYIWIPISQSIILGTLPYTQFAGGMMHAYLLPYFLISHREIVYIMNSEF